MANSIFTIINTSNKTLPVRLFNIGGIAKENFGNHQSIQIDPFDWFVNLAALNRRFKITSIRYMGDAKSLKAISNPTITTYYEKQQVSSRRRMRIDRANRFSNDGKSDISFNLEGKSSIELKINYL